jgi:hypothetical protein
MPLQTEVSGCFVFGGTGVCIQGLVLAKQERYTLTVPPTLLALVIFQIGSCVFAQASLDCDPPIYVSCVAGMSDTCYHETKSS